VEHEVRNKKNYNPTKEEVERINYILAIGDAFLIIEKYLIGCLVLIQACKNVILDKMRRADNKKISNDKGEKI
jgi:hypothetical protein